eukprot:scaffold52835_cov63-Phaeocystis_antarctica.AAC.2
MRASRLLASAAEAHHSPRARASATRSGWKSRLSEPPCRPESSHSSVRPTSLSVRTQPSASASCESMGSALASRPVAATRARADLLSSTRLGAAAFEPQSHSPSAPSASVPTASARQQCSRAVAQATEVTPAAAKERATVVKLVTVSTALRSTTTVCAAAGAAAACSSARLAAPDESSSMRADGNATNNRAAASSRSLHPPSTSTHCGGRKRHADPPKEACSCAGMTRAHRRLGRRRRYSRPRASHAKLGSTERALTHELDPHPRFVSVSTLYVSDRVDAERGATRELHFSLKATSQKVGRRSRWREAVAVLSALR